MISFTGSLTRFRAELREPGHAPVCLMDDLGEKNEPEPVRGERGGTVPAENIDGSRGVLTLKLAVHELFGVFKGIPAFASSTNDITCQ